MAPVVVVEGKSDGQKGSLMFQHNPGSTSASSPTDRDTPDQGGQGRLPDFAEGSVHEMLRPSRLPRRS